jgi:hypothetical protein
MKKIFFFLALAGLILGTSACHKDHCPAYQAENSVDVSLDTVA